MRDELVSVIIPAYNVEEYLEECVCTLLCQTYQNYEIIIIDDGSTDSTYDIGKRLAAESEKIKIFHQENQGVSIARNIGMQIAKGEYFVYVDADDVVTPQYIAVLISCIEQADMGMIGFTSEREKLTTKVNTNIIYDSASNMMESILSGTNYDGYLWDKIFHRTIIEKFKLKFKKNIVVWEDLLFVLEYLNNCKQIAISKDQLYYYRNREGSAVNNDRIDKYRSKYEAIAEIKKKNYAYTKQSKKRISLLYFEIMFSYLNQILIQKDEVSKINKILSEVKVVELLKQGNMTLFLKYMYLRKKANVS